jgi:hypothetical protein
MASEVKSRQFSFPLPNAPQSCVFLHVTVYSKTLMIFLSASSEGAAAPSNLGSFVYAMPNVSPNPTHPFPLKLTASPKMREPGAMPLCTPLFEELPTMDFAARLAKAVAKRAGKPTYVASSVDLTNVGKTHDAADDVAAFKAVIDGIMAAAVV